MKDTSQAGTAREVFARNVRKLRRLQELSQEALALEAGMSRTYVSEIEKGALADALGVPLKDLVDPEYFNDLTAKSK
jgi:transcriptional regulator with XRE-family HTH domain